MNDGLQLRVCLPLLMFYRFLVGQLPQIPMLLVCVHDGTAGEQLVANGETLARNKELVMFLNTNDYWQRKY